MMGLNIVIEIIVFISLSLSLHLSQTEKNESFSIPRPLYNQTYINDSFVSVSVHDLQSGEIYIPIYASNNLGTVLVKNYSIPYSPTSSKYYFLLFYKLRAKGEMALYTLLFTLGPTSGPTSAHKKSKSKIHIYLYIVRV